MRLVKYASTRDIPGGVKVCIVEDATGKVVAAGQWINTSVLAYISKGRPRPGYSIVAARHQHSPKEVANVDWEHAQAKRPHNKRRPTGRTAPG